MTQEYQTYIHFALLALIFLFLFECAYHLVWKSNVNIFDGKNTYYLFLLKDKKAIIWEYKFIQKIKADSIIMAEKKVKELGFDTLDYGGKYVVFDQIDYSIYFNKKK
jgi:hypothetical protein